MLPIETKHIYNILVYLFGESKQRSFSTNETQYQFNSPWATEENNGIPDNKYNLEISLSLGKYHDWANDYGGNISSLIKRWGNSELLSQYFEVIRELKEAKYYSIELFKDNEQAFNGIQSDILLPFSFTKINIKNCKRKKLTDYLEKRKITQDIIDFYNIGYTTWDEDDWTLKDRIIVPSYDDSGTINFWVGRDFSGYDKKTKYKNCTADKKEIIFQESHIQWNADIFLVEGALDCIYYPNAISLLGKSLKSDCLLYKKLLEKANANITICLDGDTTKEETKKIYSLLNTGRLTDKIWYIDLKNDTQYKDFGEIYEAEGKEGIINVIKKRKKFKEVELC